MQDSYAFVTLSTGLLGATVALRAVSLEEILLEIRSTGPVCFRLLDLPEDSQGFVDKNSN